jgi:hypothetical protein
VHNYSYMDISFDVWTGQGSWFWYIVNPNRNSGMIGAAANEMEAIREARSAIAEMSTRRMAKAVASSVVGAVEESRLDPFAAQSWNEVLAKLDSYLSQVCEFA